MRRVTQAPNVAIAVLWADTLCQAGMAATVQRQHLSSVAGELPPDQCLPEIWIDDDDRLADAKRLLAELEHVPQRRWVCACGEVVEGGFESCWSCGLAMP